MRELFDLIREGAHLDMRRMAVHTCASAVATVLMLAAVGSAAAEVAEKGVSLPLALLFLVALVLGVFSKRIVFRSAGTEIEAVLNRVRIDLAERIRHADLRALEGVGRAALFAALTRHTRSIAQTLTMLVFASQQAIVIAAASLYLLWLSPVAFLLSAGFLSVALYLYARQLRGVRRNQAEAEAAESQVAAGIAELFEGAKEIRMSTARGDALMADLDAASDSAQQARITAKKSWNASYVRVELLFFVLIGVSVFVVPLFTVSYHEVAIKVTTILLFLVGPIGGVVQNLYNIDEARSALNGIRDVRRRLAEAADAAPDDSVHAIPAPEREITLEDVTFSYREPQGGTGFTLGPISLTLRAGETVFITGGNGSGKSTLLLLLTGLIRPDSGRILVDGRPLAVGEYQAYRDSMAVIFYDFHLFRRLYGIGSPDPEAAAALIASLEIDDKVSVEGDAFTTVDLSAGQRKRLALAAAEMENKPILVLDEWAADQDPAFRRKFYGEFLDVFAGRHRFRIFVTHDDRWFDRADRVLQMVDGQVHDVTGEPAAGRSASGSRQPRRRNSLES